MWRLTKGTSALPGNYNWSFGGVVVRVVAVLSLQQPSCMQNNAVQLRIGVAYTPPPPHHHHHHGHAGGVNSPARTRMKGRNWGNAKQLFAFSCKSMWWLSSNAKFYPVPLRRKRVRRNNFSSWEKMKTNPLTAGEPHHIDCTEPVCL